MNNKNVHLQNPELKRIKIFNSYGDQIDHLDL
jgi:hypothetical protein